MKTEVANRPIEALRTVERLYPRIWDNAALCRAAKEDGETTWPDYVWLPMAGWNAAISQDAYRLALVAAVGTWRLSKGIYCFDDDLTQELRRTPMSEKAPTAAFYNLPEYCVYIATPHNPDYSGIFAHLEYDMEQYLLSLQRRCYSSIFTPLKYDIDPVSAYNSDNDPHTELRLLYLPREGDVFVNSVRVMLHIDSNNIINSLRAVYGTRSEEMLEYISGELSLLLYLCSDAPDMGDREPPKYIEPKRIKGQNKWIPRQKPEIWDVGVRIGAAIRRYGAAEKQNASDAEPTGRTVRPHIRRAHWHGFWSGPRKEPARQRFAYKWIPPIPVNLTPDGDLPAVVRDVKK